MCEWRHRRKAEAEWCARLTHLTQVGQGPRVPAQSYLPPNKVEPRWREASNAGDKGCSNIDTWCQKKTEKRTSSPSLPRFSSFLIVSHRFSYTMQLVPRLFLRHYSPDFISYCFIFSVSLPLHLPLTTTIHYVLILNDFIHYGTYLLTLLYLFSFPIQFWLYIMFTRNKFRPV